MISVCKREFRSLLRSVRGLIFLGAYLLAGGVFTLLFNFNEGSGTFEVALSYMVPVLILLLPILCVGMLGREEQGDPDRILSFLPLGAKDVILGKYLARLAMLGLPTLVLGLYPLLLDLYGDVNMATVYLTLLALLLLGAVLLALGTLLSVLCRNTYVATPVLYGISVVWYALGILAGFVPIEFLRWLLELLSPFRSLDEFVFGLPDGRILFGYLLWAALLLSLAVTVYAKKPGRPSRLPLSHPWRRLGRTLACLCLTLVVCVAALGVSLLPAAWTRTDVTAEKSYTLSEQTVSLLRELPCDVTVWVLDPSGDDVRFERFLDRMTDYSPRLTVKKVDTAKNPDFLAERELSGASFTPYSLLIESEARHQFIDYTTLFTFSNEPLGLAGITASELANYETVFAQQYPQYYAYLQYDTVQYFEGDTVIPYMIEYVAAKKIPTVYLVDGLGTNLSDTIIAYCVAYYGLEFAVWNPEESAAIPDDAAAVVLFSPDRDLTDDETAALRTYLADGGQLTLLTDESDLDKENLMSLAADFSLRAERGALTVPVEAEDEEEESEEESEEEAAGPIPDAADKAVEESITLSLVPNTEHDIMTYLADDTSFSVSVTGANAIVYPEDPAGSLFIQPILTTPAKAYLAGDPASVGEHAVAVAAETAEGGRMVWFTGADSYLNAATVNQTLSNASCVAFAASWTSWQYQTALKQVPNTPYTAMTLAVTATDATLMGALLILAVPAVAVSLCVLMRYKRKKA